MFQKQKATIMNTKYHFYSIFEINFDFKFNNFFENRLMASSLISMF